MYGTVASSQVSMEAFSEIGSYVVTRLTALLHSGTPFHDICVHMHGTNGAHSRDTLCCILYIGLGVRNSTLLTPGHVCTSGRLLSGRARTTPRARRWGWPYAGEAAGDGCGPSVYSLHVAYSCNVLLLAMVLAPAGSHARPSSWMHIM